MNDIRNDMQFYEKVKSNITPEERKQAIAGLGAEALSLSVQLRFLSEEFQREAKSRNERSPKFAKEISAFSQGISSSSVNLLQFVR